MRKWAVAIAIGCVSFAAAAQVTIPEEYAKTVKTAEAITALGEDLFGDATSLYTGATTFAATDVSLPGNNALPVSVGRRFIVQSRVSGERSDLLARDGGFADWELDIPHLHGVYAKGKGWQVDSWNEAGKNLRCSRSQANSAEAPEAQGKPLGGWEGFTYWSGNSLYVPGSGDQEMLTVDAAANSHMPKDGKQYRWVTNNQWYFSCLPNTANGVPGDSFLAVAPDGTRYHFDWFITQFAPYITRDVAEGGGTGDRAVPRAPVSTNASVLEREEVRILPTKIVDRFGNSVTYTYDPANPRRLTRIAGSDGRALTLAWSGARISTVSDGTRTWRYVYGNGLTEVILPDASKWRIDFANLREAYTTPGGNATKRCSEQTAAAQPGSYTGTITHPSGAVGEFSFRSQMHGRSYVDKQCPEQPGSGAEGFVSLQPFYFEVVGLTSKTISGPGLATAQWTYAFGPVHRSWAQDCASNTCPETKTLEVTGPGEWRRYTFGNRYRVSDGKLLSTEIGAARTNILRTEVNSWQLDPVGQTYPTVIGRSPYPRSDQSETKHAPLWKRVITQQGQAFTWEVARTCGAGGKALCFDAFARPTSLVEIECGCRAVSGTRKADGRFQSRDDVTTAAASRRTSSPSRYKPAPLDSQATGRPASAPGIASSPRRTPSSRGTSAAAQACTCLCPDCPRNAPRRCTTSRPGTPGR